MKERGLEVNIDGNLMIRHMSVNLPKEIMVIIEVFVEEVINHRNLSLLSTSLLISIFAASSGFDSIIAGINQCYGHKETRNFFIVKLISISMVFIFASSLLVTLFLIIIDTRFIKNLNPTVLPQFTTAFLGFAGIVVSFIILLITVMIIYRLSCSKKLKFVSLFPGALFTVIIWLIASKAFNIYIENFSQFSKIYGSIGSIFILMFWLNLISIVLLLGSEINALLDSSSVEEKEK